MLLLAAVCVGDIGNLLAISLHRQSVCSLVAQSHKNTHVSHTFILSLILHTRADAACYKSTTTDTTVRRMVRGYFSIKRKLYLFTNITHNDKLRNVCSDVLYSFALTRFSFLSPVVFGGPFML